MKNFLKLCSIIMLLNASQALANPVLICLGKEELLIHKNEVVGPIFFLNQHFVNQFASFSHITIKKKYLDKICHDKDFSPSVALLKTILLRGKDLYVISKEEFQKAQDVATIESFLNEIPHTFFTYLASLQKEAATHDCLYKRIRNLEYFLNTNFYAESDFSAQEIFKKGESIQVFEISSKGSKFKAEGIMKMKDRIQDTFEDLKKLDTFWDECKKEALSKKTKK